MELETVSDELYGLRPEEFTAVRDERAKAARAAGERGLAHQIRQLRRPAAAAWASNLLVREQPVEAQHLLKLGEALRQAHRDLDGEQLRELSARQRQVVFALARQAGQLTERAGRPITGTVQREVQDTLHAAMADPEAGRQWIHGCLTRPLSAAGFPTAAPAAGTTPVAAPRGARRREKPTGGSASRDRRPQREKRGRPRIEGADSELRLREREMAAAHEEQRASQEAQKQAERRLAEVSRQLEVAREEQEQAREAARHARDHAGEAERAVREAEERAEDAAAGPAAKVERKA